MYFIIFFKSQNKLFDLRGIWGKLSSCGGSNTVDKYVILHFCCAFMCWSAFQQTFEACQYWKGWDKISRNWFCWISSKHFLINQGLTLSIKSFWVGIKTTYFFDSNIHINLFIQFCVYYYLKWNWHHTSNPQMTSASNFK